MKKLFVLLCLMYIVNLQAQTYNGSEKSTGTTSGEQATDRPKENTQKTKVKGTTGTPSREVNEKTINSIKEKDSGNTNRPLEPAGDKKKPLERPTPPKGFGENTLGSDKFCAKLWEHLNNWKGEAGERAASKFDLVWYEHTSDEITKDFIPDKEVKGPKTPGQIDDKATDGQKEDINVPLRPAEEIEGLKDADKGILLATDGSFIIKNNKGRTLTAISFQEPNKKGEIWGVAKVKDKFFAVKLIWKKAKLDSRNKLVLLE